MLFYINVVVEVAEQDELFNIREWEWVEELDVARKKKEEKLISGKGYRQLWEEIKRGDNKSNKHGPYM